MVSASSELRTSEVAVVVGDGGEGVEGGVRR